MVRIGIARIAFAIVLLFPAPVLVHPLDVAVIDLAAELAGKLAGTAPGVPNAFGAASAEAPSLVQRVEVRVVWDDGIFERSAERVTFAFDTQAAQALASGLEMPPGAAR